MKIDFGLPDTLFSQYFTAIAHHESVLTAPEKLAINNALPARAMSFSTGRYCAKSALRALGANDCEILKHSNGMPHWPPGFVGSISHSPNLAGAIVGRQSELASVGLDIERESRVSSTMWNMVFTEQERYYLYGHSATEQLLLASLFFSIKESFYKLQFPLTHYPMWFTDVEIQLQENQFRVLLLKVLPETKALPEWTNAYCARYEDQVISLCFLEA